MNKWIRRAIYGLFGASIVLGGLTACGHRHEAMGPQASAQDQSRFREKMIERVAERLELTAEQRRRLGVLADSLQAQRAALKGSGTDPRAEVRALVAGEKFDRARAEALVTEKTAAITRQSPEVIAAAGDFYDSLDPRQQARVREFMQRRHGWWRRG